MLADATAAELVDLGDKAVEELTVVADDDGRTVEGADSLFQHVLRRHIEVVRGLVEYQQVNGLQQQLDHRQTAPLAAAEHLHLLVAVLATKHEGAENVVDAQAHVAFGHVVDGLEHRQLLVKQLGLVLGEVAYLHVVAYLQMAVKGYLAHDTLHQRRLALAVLADKGDLLAALDGEVHVAEDLVVAIHLLHLVADDGVVAGAQTGGELQVHGRIVNVVHLDGHDFLQLLHLLLHLYGLRRLIAEALYKRLHVGDFLLLVLVGAQLLFAALAAQRDVLVVLHAVVNDPAAGYLQRAVRDVIDKRPVVTHQHHRRRRLRQKLL